MIELSLLLIVAGIFVFRWNQSIGEMKKSTDEEWGLTSSTKEGHAFLAKVFGTLMVIAGAIMGLVHLLRP